MPPDEWGGNRRCPAVEVSRALRSYLLSPFQAVYSITNGVRTNYKSAPIST
jgi:hypothetical protein